MKITIIGSGNVGLVTGTSLAEPGNDVLCLDLNATKNEMLNAEDSFGTISGGIAVDLMHFLAPLFRVQDGC